QMEESRPLSASICVICGSSLIVFVSFVSLWFTSLFQAGARSRQFGVALQGQAELGRGEVGAAVRQVALAQAQMSLGGIDEGDRWDAWGGRAPARAFRRGEAGGGLPRGGGAPRGVVGLGELVERAGVGGFLTAQPLQDADGFFQITGAAPP